MIPVRRRAGLALATLTLTAGLVPALTPSALAVDELLDLTPLTTGCTPRWNYAPGKGDSWGDLYDALYRLRAQVTAAGGWSAGMRGERPWQLDVATGRFAEAGMKPVQGLFPGDRERVVVLPRVPHVGDTQAFASEDGRVWDVLDPDEWANDAIMRELGRPEAHYLVRSTAAPDIERGPIAELAGYPGPVGPRDGTGIVEEQTDAQGRRVLCEWDAAGTVHARYALDAQGRLLTVLKPWGVFDVGFGPQDIDLPAASDTASYSAYWYVRNDVYARANAAKVAKEVNALRGRARATAATLAKATARVVRKPVAGSVRPLVRYRAAVTTVSAVSARRGHPWLYRVTISRQGRPVARKVVT